MMGTQAGATLYVTELFVPRQETFASTSPKAALSSSWSAERIQRILQQRVCRRSDADEPSSDPSTLQTHDPSATEAWVVEVGAQPADWTDRDGAVAIDEPLTSSLSLYDILRLFSHIFVEVVWVGAGGKPEVSVADTVRCIVADLERQYHTPVLRLDAFRCFTQRSSDAAATTSTSSNNAAYNTAETTRGATIITQLREPCAPAILADTESSHVSALCSTCLYSATGGAFVQLLLPDATQARDPAPPSRGCGTHRFFICGPDAAGNQRGGGPRAEVSLKAIATATSGMCNLLQDQLRLTWEGLSVAAPAPYPQRDREGAEGDGAETVAVALATLALDPLPTPTSLYSFSSVEHAWEAHVARSMTLKEKGDKDTRRWREWKLQKLPTPPSPSISELSRIMDEAEMQQVDLDNPFITAAERAMLYAAASSGQPPIAPRCSTYLLRLVAAPQHEPLHTSQDTAGRENNSEGRGRESLSDELCLLQLHAPRVQSRHAVVVCMQIPAAWREAAAREEKPAEMPTPAKEDNSDSVSRLSYPHATSRWAAALSSSYRLASYTPSLWLPRDVGRGATSGVCGRSGRLVLHVPAGDARYEIVQLAPVAAKSFASLGSIAAWVQREDDWKSCSTTCPLKDGPAFDQVGAVWTLIGDGRSAAAYLEDALMEYMYDTGSKNLNNVHQPSQHAQQPGVLCIRKRQRQKGRVLTASGQATAASHLGLQEVCSAWVDVGAAHRLLLRVRDVGVGEVLVTEASLVGPHTEKTTTRSADEGEATEAERVSRAEEEALESWVEGIAASAIQKNLR
ncbi:hypothetical protein ABB37_09333 [Leptomonas pyrrhocoris]|uniref:Uncharacterized protein n=1 Tax=Leptomonas pyrrhocoris TaxID=157538 RepID=A0A0M9FR82_LEPPY|nr:hypothetical protein ABB37_09333 [Leptomonas pyrrhocoris]KPA74353.1 hypothetical protein ABB37_09333 [Leptomonas pyrrhocoris]|eukprot:XP_015652792.1 hypothetical protein ABB37_09333 [Leptomonas pyrrhocoris]